MKVFTRTKKLIPSIAALSLAITLSACSSGSSSSSTTTTTVPSASKSLLQKGLAAQKAGNYPQARSYYQQAIAADPTNAGNISAIAYYDMGVIDQRNGNRAGALANYNKALALYPNFQSALYNTAILNTATNPTRALELYNRLIVLNPKYANALFNSGLLAYQMGNTTLGVQRIKAAIAIDPALAKRVPASVNLNQ